MSRRVTQPTIATKEKAKPSHARHVAVSPAKTSVAGQPTRPQASTASHPRSLSPTFAPWALSEDGDRLRRVAWRNPVGTERTPLAHICSIESSWEPVRFDPYDYALFFVPDHAPTPRATVIDLGVYSSIPKDCFIYLGLLGRRLGTTAGDSVDITFGFVTQVEVEKGIKYLCDKWADDEGLFIDDRHIRSKDPIPWRAQLLRPTRPRDVNPNRAYDVGLTVRRIRSPPSSYPLPPSDQESADKDPVKIKYSLRSSSILPARGKVPPMLITNLRAFAPLESLETFDALQNSDAEQGVDDHTSVPISASNSVLTGEAAIQRYNQLILALYNPKVHAAGIIAQNPEMQSTEFSQTLMANFKWACEDMGFVVC